MFIANKEGGRSPFSLIKPAPKRGQADLRGRAQRVFEFSLLSTLIGFTLLVVLLPKWEIKSVPMEEVYYILEAEQIPPTIQGVPQPPPPAAPAVPIPSEIIEMVEDLDFVDYTFDYAELPPLPGPPTGLRTTSGAPRLIKEAFPFISQGDRKRFSRGVVKYMVQIDKSGRVVDVEIINNSTGSSSIANAVLTAAFKCRYLPARYKDRVVVSKTIRTFSFNFSKK